MILVVYLMGRGIFLSVGVFLLWKKFLGGVLSSHIYEPQKQGGAPPS